ncbi:MAG: hypothetical protein OQK98_15010 [Gammaproteobacteria bacterium]|nr:hypothetical protein [Gammaproteobacteria bacterium]
MEHNIANKSQLIIDIEKCKFNNAILVNSFEGYVALPDNYYIQAKSATGALVLSKSKYKSNDRNGYIEFGGYTGERPKHLLKDKERYKLVDINEYKDNDFNVIEQKHTIVELNQATIFINGQYMKVVDKSSNLWGDAIKSYNILKNTNCKQ